MAGVSDKLGLTGLVAVAKNFSLPMSTPRESEVLFLSSSERHCCLNERLMLEKSLKNGYPFDLSKVCHLVDIPITSKIKCVCLNIILMFGLGTKGQTADH